MLLLLKATNVKNPGARGGDFWIDEHGKARYDERPKPKLPEKYIAYVILSDGTKKYVYPDDAELDDNHQVIGGQPKIREIINRELFGEYGFKKNGTFWQKKGILVEYKTRVTAKGKVEVDAIQRHDGYTAFEFRDSSVSRAYGTNNDGSPSLPKKISQYKVPARISNEAGLPSKEKIELDDKNTVTPHVEELARFKTPKRLPENRTSVGEPLKDAEDPIAIASAYLDATFRMRRPSKAKTEAGQQKARDERKGQTDEVIGSRNIEPLPVWAIAKFDSPEHLQRELARDEDGHPLTTLITLGIWNQDTRNKRVKDQLLAEWTPFLRRWSRRMASIYQNSDSYRKFDKIGQGGDKASREWIYERERDLFNEGVAVLIEEANRYMANDEPRGPDSRFDLKAGNAIKNALEKKAKESVLESHGGTALEDLSEEDAYHAPKMISPREHFELRHYEPQAVAILSDAVATLKPEVRAAFLSKLWIDDHSHHPDASEERAWNERRAKRLAKHGESNLHWGRPWIRSAESVGVEAMSDKLADVEITLRGGKKAKLRDLKPQHQMYYLEKWFGEAMAHVESHLKTSKGKLTSDGQTVEKWLRLEAKLAHVNHKELSNRLAVGTIEMPVKFDEHGREIKRPVVEHLRVQEHPAVTFFKQPNTNYTLAQRLGIVDDLDLPLQQRGVNLPKQQQQRVDRVIGYHKRLQDNLKHVGDLAPLHAEAKAAAERHKDFGSWYTTPHGTPEWHEKHGVVALHNAAVRLHESGGKDEAAVAAFTEATANLGKDHPMVQDYVRRLSALGVDKPTSGDLATWKARSHSMYREHANRLHLVEFAQEQRSTQKSIKDLRKAFAYCLDAYDQLGKAMR